MNYFFLKYTDNISEKYAGETFGPLIKIRPKHSESVGLLEHEKTHVRQWYFCFLVLVVLATILACTVYAPLAVIGGLGPSAHGVMYKFCRPYRLWSEVQAYRKQIEEGSYVDIAFAVSSLAADYDLNIDERQASLLLSE